MIGEWLTHLTTPCGQPFRRMGYLRELIAIRERHRRCRTAWRIHLAASRALIPEAIESCSGRERVVVLGSGLLLDIPLAELAGRFDTVVLIDICHLRTTRRKAARFANVELEEADVSGIAEALGSRRLNDRAPLPEPEPDAGPLSGADLVISANLLSQLPLVPLDHLEVIAPELSKAERDRFARSVIDHHLALLQAQSATVCLITETMRSISDGENLIEKIDPLFGATLFYEGREWWWDMAPRPEVNRNLDVLCGWLPRCKDFLTTWRPNRVRSCVRPVDAVFLNRWP